MQYLSSEDILLIHSVAIDETGSSHGVRDRHALPRYQKATGACLPAGRGARG
ncbi:MAG: hypothetical protein UY71_C0011G0009 [Parcubacteria group bacterium GW2011_GWB1_52_7]|nr:MAG: hypothetical protein UY64_C0045G0005 [Parcubacteria group bacterium GW2011_GWA1_51_12]KKW28758.1 MAG: hypothetical protein UY71_C0011G0009 [Parcubacteria group bacterium GW2011_GWB1_52_7]